MSDNKANKGVRIIMIIRLSYHDDDDIKIEHIKQFCDNLNFKMFNPAYHHEIKMPDSTDNSELNKLKYKRYTEACNAMKNNHDILMDPRRKFASPQSKAYNEILKEIKYHWHNYTADKYLNIKPPNIQITHEIKENKLMTKSVYYFVASNQIIVL